MALSEATENLNQDEFGNNGSLKDSIHELAKGSKDKDPVYTKNILSEATNDTGKDQLMHSADNAEKIDILSKATDGTGTLQE